MKILKAIKSVNDDITSRFDFKQIIFVIKSSILMVILCIGIAGGIIYGMEFSQWLGNEPNSIASVAIVVISCLTIYAVFMYSMVVIKRYKSLS